MRKNLITMRKGLPYIFSIISLSIFMWFCEFIYRSFSSPLFRYGLYRSFLFSVANDLLRSFASIFLISISLYLFFFVIVAIIKKFCKRPFQSALEIVIKDKSQLIRIIFSSIISLLFLIIDGWIVNKYFICNKNLFIVMFVNFLIILIAVFLWLLFVQGRWENLWNIILLRKTFLLRPKSWIISIVIILAVIILRIALIIDSNMNKPAGPNVIFISIDTLRSDHLGCYGYSKNTTPNIDKFSKDSVLFRNCIAQSSSTTTSHASMFTSLIPSHHKASHSANIAISEDVITLCEFLKDENYTTISYNGGGQVASIYGFDRGFDIYHSFNETGKDKFSLIVEQAMQWLEGHKEERYFLFLHTYESHHPYTPPKDFLHSLESKYEGDLPEEISVELLEEINDGEKTINDQDLEHIINVYDGEIRSIDHAFGEFLQFLKKIGHYNDVLIIFTSDHGEEFNEHGIVGWHSHSLYEELLRVPLLIKMPQTMYKGRIIAENIRSIDILPTILDLMNRSNSDYFSGLSLMPLIRDNNLKDELYIVSQLDRPEYNIASIRKGKWKWYDYQLFDLLKDPEEKYNVYVDNKQIAASLESKLKEIVDFSKISYTKSNKIKKEEMSTDLEEQLKSLGYL